MKWLPTYLSAIVFILSLAYYRGYADRPPRKAYKAFTSTWYAQTLYFEGTNIRRDHNNLDSLYHAYFDK